MSESKTERSGKPVVIVAVLSAAQSP
jgi:hypothetical protein